MESLYATHQYLVAHLDLPIRLAYLQAYFHHRCTLNQLDFYINHY